MCVVEPCWLKLFAPAAFSINPSETSSSPSAGRSLSFLTIPVNSLPPLTAPRLQLQPVCSGALLLQPVTVLELFSNTGIKYVLVVSSDISLNTGKCVFVWLWKAGGKSHSITVIQTKYMIRTLSQALDVFTLGDSKSRKTCLLCCMVYGLCLHSRVTSALLSCSCLQSKRLQ